MLRRGRMADVWAFGILLVFGRRVIWANSPPFFEIFGIFVPKMTIFGPFWASKPLKWPISPARRVVLENRVFHGLEHAKIHIFDPRVIWANSPPFLRYLGFLSKNDHFGPFWALKTHKMANMCYLGILSVSWDRGS